MIYKKQKRRMMVPQLVLRTNLNQAKYTHLPVALDHDALLTVTLGRPVSLRRTTNVLVSFRGQLAPLPAAGDSTGSTLMVLLTIYLLLLILFPDAMLFTTGILILALASVF